MTRKLLIASLLTFATVELAWPTTPPPPATFKQEICAASHVFIGRTKNVRFVNVSKSPLCRDEPATSGAFLTLCGSAEADVEVEEVLLPVGWKPDHPVVYQFGGGYFSLEKLKGDLEGNRYLLHTVLLQAEPKIVLGPSYPWVLSKSVEDRKRVEKALRECKPK